jgi:PLP dependent protein
MAIMTSAIDRLRAIETRIAAAAARVGRLAETVRLVAVSKTFGVDDIRPLLEAGHRCFGENRVQEAQAKWRLLRRDYSDIELHLIGPLQSNKCAEAVELFDVIQTVDRAKIADLIAVESARQKRVVKCLVQVNTGDEPQKAGVTLADARQFIADCRTKISVTGLMCIPPVDDSAAKHFLLLAQLAADTGVAELSMGMSSDFEAAVAEGATQVRVGSAIFGGRAAAH